MLLNVVVLRNIFYYKHQYPHSLFHKFEIWRHKKTSYISTPSLAQTNQHVAMLKQQDASQSRLGGWGGHYVLHSRIYYVDFK